jgi:hypothetical protein
MGIMAMHHALQQDNGDDTVQRIICKVGGIESQQQLSM